MTYTRPSIQTPSPNAWVDQDSPHSEGGGGFVAPSRRRAYPSVKRTFAEVIQQSGTQLTTASEGKPHRAVVVAPVHLL